MQYIAWRTSFFKVLHEEIMKYEIHCALAFLKHSNKIFFKRIARKNHEIQIHCVLAFLNHLNKLFFKRIT